MDAYIPGEALRDPENEGRIRDILNKVPYGDVRMDGEYSLDDALNEIKELGEQAVANLISME